MNVRKLKEFSLALNGLGAGHIALEELYQIDSISAGADIFNLFVIIQISVYLLGGMIYFIYNNEYQVPALDKKKISEPIIFFLSYPHSFLFIELEYIGCQKRS